MFGLFEYKADMLPTELPRLVFGSKNVWVGGAIDGTHTSSDIVFKND